MIPNVILCIFLNVLCFNQNVELLPALQMSWKSLSLCSRLWSLMGILLHGPHCMSTLTTRSDMFPHVFLLWWDDPQASWPFSSFFSQREEKHLSEKSLHPPASPAMLPDHLKCNILKAQMEAAFRVSSKSHFPLISLSNLFLVSLAVWHSISPSFSPVQ